MRQCKTTKEQIARMSWLMAPALASHTCRRNRIVSGRLKSRPHLSRFTSSCGKHSPVDCKKLKDTTTSLSQQNGWGRPPSRLPCLRRPASQISFVPHTYALKSLSITTNGGRHLTSCLQAFKTTTFRRAPHDLIDVLVNLRQHIIASTVQRGRFSAQALHCLPLL